MIAIRDFLTNFHLGAASGWDIFIILVFLIAVLVYGLFLGRNRMIVLLISTYFSLIISRVIPWERMGSAGWLGMENGPSVSLEIIIFLGLILLFYFLIPRSILSSTLRLRKRGEASWIFLFLLSILQIGLVAMIIFSFLPSQAIANLSSLVQRMFLGSSAEFVWTILPIMAVVLIKKKKKTGKSKK